MRNHQGIRQSTYTAYRSRLEAFLQIPTDASDQEIHELMEKGFATWTVVSFCDVAKLSPVVGNQIITLKNLNTRLAGGQRLTIQESDRLYRFAHITATAEAIFCSDSKSQRWLSKPKDCFLGVNSPLAVGCRYVSVRLNQQCTYLDGISLAGRGFQWFTMQKIIGSDAMNNVQRASSITQALDAFLAEAARPEVSIIGTKKALRTAMSDALRGTQAECWTEQFLDRFAPWEPARYVNEEQIRLRADRMAADTFDLKYVFKDWKLQDDMGV